MAQRISIGFHASAPLATRVSDDELSRLQSALADSGSRWHDLKGEDGEITLKLESVQWLRVEKDDQRVGFGIGG
jgi:hypothetical protein